MPANGTPSAIQRSSPDPTFGTAKSTAPVASNKIKPQNIMLGELTHEAELFNAARLVIAWVEKKRTAPPQPPYAESGQQAQKAANSFAFSAAELFADKTTIKKMNPVPKDETELIAVLDLLFDYGVLSRPIYSDPADTEPKYTLLMDKVKGVPATEKFAEAQAETSKFTEAFRKRVAKNDPLASVVSTGTIPTDWSSDLAQVKEEGKAEAGLADLKMQLGEFFVILAPVGGNPRTPLARATTDAPTPVSDKSGKTVAWDIPIATQKKPVRFSDPFEKIEKVADGTHPETVKRRELIEKEIKKAEADLKVKGRYRTFADEVVVLLSRLRKRNTTWKAGTYIGHSWAEFSADIFLSTSFDKVAAGFWNRDVVSTFFDDLNAAAEEDDGTVGKFAWRAIYNDDPLRDEINKKYGADRVLHVPHHGPHPDKLHIHLDLTPVNLHKDQVTGYEIKEGRIRVLKP